MPGRPLAALKPFVKIYTAARKTSEILKVWLVFSLAGIFSALIPYSCAYSAELYQQSKSLLHTFVEIKAYGDNQTDVFINDTFNEMGRVNNLLNNYDPASDVSLINAAAGNDVVKISPETFSALSDAKKYAILSHGAFDFTVGPLVALWGFNQDQPGLSVSDPDDTQIAQVQRLVDYKALQLSQGPSGASAILKHKGMHIDTGAFGKGFVADRAIQFLREKGIKSTLVAAGGTICAIGLKPDGKPWQIGIRHPRNSSSFLTVIPLRDQSVSTSGDYEKFYYKAGKRRTHIIDPRTGTPVSTIQSVTVIAPQGIASDALSTALFVLGPVDGLALIDKLSGVEALIVTASGEVLYSEGWPQKVIVY
jgi:thiamine biosynthesis lipoprotein